MPLSESISTRPAEVLAHVEATGERPIDLLARIGLLGPRTQCVHMTALGSQDIEAVAAPARRALPALQYETRVWRLPCLKLRGRYQHRARCGWCG